MENIKLVRSFVRRERRSQQHFSKKLWNHYILNSDIGSLELKNCFSLSGPLTLEIGFGTGDTLFSQAQLYTNQNYIGIEVYQTGIKKLLSKLDQHPLDNIKIFEGDASYLLTQYAFKNQFDSVQILFPDPWPKTKHHKRRLIQETFVKTLFNILKPGGKLYLATDWEHYARHMLRVIENSPFINDAGQQCFSKRPTTIPLTKFEQRGMNLGHSIFYIVLTKCP